MAYEAKTKPTDTSVEDFINSLEPETRRQDARKFLQLFQEETSDEPVLWGKDIIGFGWYKYRYASGHEGETALAAFSPRAKEFSLYLFLYPERSQELLRKIGKARWSKGCIYVKKFEDLDQAVLRDLIHVSTDEFMKTGVVFASSLDAKKPST